MGLFGRNRDGANTTTAAWVTEVCESVEIAGDPERVWALIQPAANAILLNPAIVEAFTVPGTPVGEAGEQQTVVTVDFGDRVETTIEVSGIVPGTYAEWFYPGSPNGGGWVQLSPSPAGTRLTWATRYEVTNATLERAEAAYRDQLRGQLACVQQLIEAGWPELDNTNHEQ